MTLQSISSRWVRGGLLAAALITVALAILLVPRVTSGQTDQPDEADLMNVDDGSLVYDEVEIPADLQNSPYFLSAAAFVPEGDTDGQYMYQNFGPGGDGGWFSRTNAATTTVCYVAPVHLPDGAIIKRFEVYGIDDNASYLWWNYIYQKQYNYGNGGADAAPTLLASFTTTGWDSNQIQARVNSSDINAVVDNGTYHYYVRVCPNKFDHLVYGMRVYYTD